MYMLDDAPHGYLLNEVDGIELWSRTLTKTELYGSLLSSKIIKDPEKSSTVLTNVKVQNTLDDGSM